MPASEISIHFVLNVHVTIETVAKKDAADDSTINPMKKWNKESGDNLTMMMKMLPLTMMSMLK